MNPKSKKPIPIIISVIGIIFAFWGVPEGISGLYKLYKPSIDIEFQDINEEGKRHLIISNSGHFPIEILEDTEVDVAKNKNNQGLLNLKVTSSVVVGIPDPSNVIVRNGKTYMGVLVKNDFKKIIDNNFFTKSMIDRIVYPTKSSSKIPILQKIEKEKLEIIDFVFCISIHQRQIFSDNIIGNIHELISKILLGKDPQVINRYFKFSNGKNIIIKEISKQKVDSAKIDMTTGEITL